MIRIAKIGDVPRLVEMGVRFIRESTYRDFIDADPAMLGAMMRRLLASETAVIYVAERLGAVCGMIGVFAYQHPMSGKPIGGEAFWWTEEPARGRDGIDLFDRGEAWLKAAGAQKIQMIAPNEKVARFYRSRGYRKFEEQFQRDITT